MQISRGVSAILLLLAAPGDAHTAEPLESRRVTLFEPCADLLAHGSAHAAPEQAAAAGSYAYERVGADAGVAGWLRLLEDPPAALYIHTVGDTRLIGVACFATPRARQFAIEELASDPDTRNLTVEPRVYTDSERRVWVIAMLRQPSETKLLEAGTFVYLHLANGPRFGGGAAPEVVGDASLSPPLVNHRAFATRYFREHLAGGRRAHFISREGRAADSSNVPDRPDLWITPRSCRLTAPLAELPITLRNVGGVALVDLRFTTVLNSDLIRVRNLGRLPDPLSPNAEANSILSIDSAPDVPAGQYPVVYAVGGRVGRGSRNFYDAFGDLLVVVNRPPKITAPSSVEFSLGGSVEVSAQDPDGQEIHLEAFLPPGVDLHHLGAGRAELRFAQDDFPGVPVSEVVLVAWSGDDRDTARARVQKILIVGGDVGPTPWLLIGAYGAALAMILAAYFQHRLYARRRRVADPRLRGGRLM